MMADTLKCPQRRFGDPLQVRKRQRIPLPQGTHGKYWNLWLFLLAWLTSWVVVGLIFAAVWVSVFGIPKAFACGDTYQPPQPVKISVGPAA